MRKPIIGKSHNKVGTANLLSPHGLENQRGTDRGNKSLFNQIKNDPIIIKIILKPKQRKLLLYRLFELVNDKIFIVSYQIIVGVYYLLKFGEISGFWFLDQDKLWCIFGNRKTSLIFGSLCTSYVEKRNVPTCWL